MTRSVYREVEWTLGADPDADPPERQIRCAADGCGGHSSRSEGQLGPDSWALEHAGATGHRGYVEVVEARLRAIPVDEVDGPVRGQPRR